MESSSDSRDVGSQTSECARRLEQTDNPQEWRQLVQQMIPLLSAYWDVHPHSAMEMLEYSTFRLPVPLAHALVREVVTNWKQKPTYDPEAGGNADHCYLSALILSENFDLADSGWVDRVLEKTLKKELGYPRFEQMRDPQKREALVRAIAQSVGFVAPPGTW